MDSAKKDFVTMDPELRTPQQWTLHNGLRNNGHCTMASTTMDIAPFYSATIEYATMVPATMDSTTINPAKIESATFDPETMLPATMGVSGMNP